LLCGLLGLLAGVASGVCGFVLAARRDGERDSRGHGDE
jgi:hypothetical protein